MESLEQKINKLIREFKGHKKAPVEIWVWLKPTPDTLQHSLKAKDKELLMLKLKIDILIDKALDEECSSSVSWYVRECKKWMNNNNFQERWAQKWREESL